MRFDNLTLVHEQPNMISNRHAVRIYTTTHSDEEVRYHVGLPAELLPVSVWLLAETEPYIGETHWTEQDGFNVFWLSETGHKTQPLPFPRLQRHIERMIQAIKSAVGFFQSTSK